MQPRPACRPVPSLHPRALRSALRAALVLALVWTCAACVHSGAAGPAPAMPDVLPKALPEVAAKAQDQGVPRLIQDPDGFLYAVHLDKAAPPQVGQAYALRYGPSWDEATFGESPVLGLVRVHKVFAGEGDKATSALVQPELLLPGIEPADAVLEPWTEAEAPSLGKGLATIASLDGSSYVELNLGLSSGVQPGDRFVALAAPEGDRQRLSQRLAGVIKVIDVRERTARARVMVNGGIGKSTLQAGQWALFIAPGFQDKPLKTTIQVSKVIGGSSADQQAIVRALKRYLKQFAGEQIEVEALDASIAPIVPNFGRESAGLEYVDTPRMLVSAKVAKRRGEERLVLNYTSTGLSVAGGMIAATPERGFDAGPASGLSPDALAPLFHNLLAATFAHRGQVAEALYLLEVVLQRGGWDGPARWHARDQLAMRWAQAGQLRNALRMVHEDVALGEKRGDKAAVINAVGTLMPFYEDLGDMERSLAEAKRFYDLRAALSDGPYADHARRAWIEMLYRSDKLDQAAKEHDAFRKDCQVSIQRARSAKDPKQALRSSCAVDLFYLGITAHRRSDDANVRRQALRDAELLAEDLSELNMASVRLLQGSRAVLEQKIDTAQIAFLEARRLFDKNNFTPGRIHVDTFLFNLFLSQEDRQGAFDAAMSAVNTAARLQNVSEMASIYRMMARIYINVPPRDHAVASYARNAPLVLSEVLKLQHSTNDLAAVAEIFYISGQFRLQTKPQQAEDLLRKSIEFAKRSARFDLAAQSYVIRALIARAKGNAQDFRAFMEAAKSYARMSGNPSLLQSIQGAEQGGGPSRDTL